MPETMLEPRFLPVISSLILPTFTPVPPPTKYIFFADSSNNPPTGSTSTCVFFLYDIPSFCHNCSHTADPDMHHPAMDSKVVTTQCGKVTTVFVPSKDCDIVVKVLNVVPKGWI